MKKHYWIASVLFCVLAVLFVALLTHPSHSSDARQAIVFQSHFECPSYSGKFSSRFVLEMVRLRGDSTIERTDLFESFATLEIRFARIANGLIETRLNDTPESSEFCFGNFYGPLEHAEIDRISYKIYKDESGFYLSHANDPTNVRYRFKCKDESEVMWEVDRVVCNDLFPSDLKSERRMTMR